MLVYTSLYLVGVLWPSRRRESKGREGKGRPPPRIMPEQGAARQQPQDACVVAGIRWRWCWMEFPLPRRDFALIVAFSET